MENTDFSTMLYLLKKSCPKGFYVQDLDYYDKKLDCVKVGKVICVLQFANSISFSFDESGNIM